MVRERAGKSQQLLLPIGFNAFHRFVGAVLAFRFEAVTGPLDGPTNGMVCKQNHNGADHGHQQTI
jgi:hypothetical protein